MGEEDIADHEPCLCRCFSSEILRLCSVWSTVRIGTELRRNGSYKLVLCPCMAMNDEGGTEPGVFEFGNEGEDGADSGPTGVLAENMGLFEALPRLLLTLPLNTVDGDPYMLLLGIWK